MTNKISLTRALAEIKILKDRIEKAAREINFVGVGLGASKVPTNRAYRDAKSFEEASKSSFNSWQDLMNRRALLKRKINAANAVTMVTVGSKQMTIAEAVELKGQVAAKQDLINRMKGALVSTEREMREAEAKLDLEVEKLAASVKNDNPEKTAETVKALRNLASETKKPVLLDPLGLQERIKTMESELSDFTLNVDFALSEVNAKTEIEV